MTFHQSFDKTNFVVVQNQNLGRDRLKIQYKFITSSDAPDTRCSCRAARFKSVTYERTDTPSYGDAINLRKKNIANLANLHLEKVMLGQFVDSDDVVVREVGRDEIPRRFKVQHFADFVMRHVEIEQVGHVGKGRQIGDFVVG